MAPPEGAGLPTAAPALSTTRAMGGTKARLGTLTSGSLDIEGARAAIGTALPRIDACFATNELEPPNHESVTYDMEVAASGAVKSAEPGTLSGRVARLDTCVVAALRAVRMPRSPGGGRVKLTLTARIADPQQTR